MAGVKGVNQKPTELKRIRGTEKPSRMKPDEPTPTPGFPFPPKTFTRRQLECYEDLIASLKELNVTTCADGKALAEMALTLEELNNLTQALNDDDHKYLLDVSTVIVRETKKITTTTRRAAYMLNPLLKTRHELWGIYWRMLQSFGMTPTSRQNVKSLPTNGTENEFFS